MNPFKLVLVLFLSFQLCMIGPAQARSTGGEELTWFESVVAEWPLQNKNHPQLAISWINSSQQESLVRSLLEARNHSVVIYYSGRHDPVFKLVNSDPQLRKKAILVNASDVQPIQLNPKRWGIWKKLKNLGDAGTGVLVAAGTAGVFAAPFYFSANLDVATKIYFASLTVFTLQAVFTQQWQKLLGLGGKASAALHGFVRKVLNKSVDSSSHAVVDTGRLLTAVGFNIGTNSLYLGLSGELDSVWTVLTLATLGVYDITWDLVATRLQELKSLSAKTTKRFIQSRVLFGALLDSLAITAAGPALVAMGLLAGTGIFSLYKAEPISRWLAKRTKFLKSLPHIRLPCHNLLLMRPYYEDMS